jgi:hypothetical protein
MADTTNLPEMTQTVDLGGGAQIEGDPLEFMRQVARENIESVNNNPIVVQKDKIEFKKYVLSKLKIQITKFEEIDKRIEEEKAAKEEESEGEETEEDAFADIFADESGENDESMQEKMTIAQKFASDIKIYKTKFLKDIRISREQAEQKKEEKKLKAILEQLNNV